MRTRKWIEEGLDNVVYDSAVCEYIDLWTCLRGVFNKGSMGQSEQCIFRHKKLKKMWLQTLRRHYETLYGERKHYKVLHKGNYVDKKHEELWGKFIWSNDRWKYYNKHESKIQSYSWCYIDKSKDLGSLKAEELQNMHDSIIFFYCPKCYGLLKETYIHRI